jgi:hypothetical protein
VGVLSSILSTGLTINIISELVVKAYLLFLTALIISKTSKAIKSPTEINPNAITIIWKRLTKILFETTLNKTREITVNIAKNSRLLKTILTLSLGLENFFGLGADLLVFFTLFFRAML